MRKEGEKTEVGQIVSERRIFDHQYFPVIERVVITPDGQAREAQLLWDRGGRAFSVALAITADNKFVLIQEPKYGQMRNLLTIPAGGVKRQETPLEAAIRELREETGYEAESWVELSKVPIIDFADKIDGGQHHFFLGSNAQKVSEPEQFREVFLITQELAERLIDGEIEHLKMEIAMSLVGLLLGLRNLQKKGIKNE